MKIPPLRRLGVVLVLCGLLLVSARGSRYLWFEHPVGEGPAGELSGEAVAMGLIAHERPHDENRVPNVTRWQSSL
mgnify:CR=1 FL=1